MTYTRNKGRLCSVAGCGRPANKRGMCRTHGVKWYLARRAGTLEIGKWREIAYHRRNGIRSERIAFPSKLWIRIEQLAGLRGLHPIDIVVEATKAYVNEKLRSRLGLRVEDYAELRRTSPLEES